MKRALGRKWPYEAQYGHPPDLSNLHLWGCIVYVQVDAPSKLDARGKPAHWIGLDSTSNGHWIYWPKQRKISVECNVVFSSDSPCIEGEYDSDIGSVKQDDDIVEPPTRHTHLEPSPKPSTFKPESSLELGEIHEPVDPNIITGK